MADTYEDDIEALRDIFESFCGFGSRSQPSDSMDSSKFSKFARDSKLVDKRLTRTEVDLIFTRTKQKGQRRISFGEFLDALHSMAEVKFPRDEAGAAYDKLVARILGSDTGPSVNSSVADVVTSTDDTTARLTDVSGYTGSHKHRFNDDGTGRGLAGRDRAARGAGTNVGSVVGAGDGAINAEVAGNDGYVSGFRRSGSREDAGAGRDSGRRSGGGSGKRRGERSSGRRDGGGAGGQKKAKSKSRSQAITDRLTDTSTYTGAHKHRFDSSGHGRGREGRTEEVEYTGYVAAFDDARDSPDDSGAERVQKKKKKARSNRAADITARLTDASQYTGSHRHRFNDDGTGRGREGRTDEVEHDGYVANYRHKGTYDENH